MKVARINLVGKLKWFRKRQEGSGGEKKAIYGFQPQINESQRNAKRRGKINAILLSGMKAHAAEQYLNVSLWTWFGSALIYAEFSFEAFLRILLPAPLTLPKAKSICFSPLNPPVLSYDLSTNLHANVWGGLGFRKRLLGFEEQLFDSGRRIWKGWGGFFSVLIIRFSS